ncbi:hypothetical protein ACJMK2_029557 [Sinanodonta woodiana]|uniref:CUB domain-containing protein n=1 Tax=Sinanodonta woodiana TaxID=1069815 RepID=A0ABD3XAI5_SINWO
MHAFLVAGAVWCVQICPVHVIRDSACIGTTLPCDYYRMSCNDRSIIQVDKLQYGMQQGRCQINNYTRCKVDEIGCCARNSNDCFEDFNQDHTKSVLEKCSGHSSCGPMQAVQARLSQPHCSSQFSNYVIVDYSCVNGTSLLNLGSDLTLTGPEVNVIFNSAANDTIYRNHSTSYTCRIEQNGYQAVNLELLDIRLQKPGVAQSCSSVKINIPNANFSAKCSENMQQNNVYMPIFSIDDMFSLNSGDYPVMIWIKFQAYSSYTVSVTCQDQTFPDGSGGETTIKDMSNNNTGVILGVLIPVLFLIAAVIVGVIFFRRRHRHIIEKRAVMEFQNKVRYGELPTENPKLVVTLSNSVYADIDESKIASNVSATSRECSHCSDQQDEYLVPSQIPEECAPKLDGSSSCSKLGFDQNLKDESETKPKSDNCVSNISSVHYVNTVDGKSPKKTKASKIERLINTLSFENKDLSAETKKATDKVLKVKRLADDYIEFEQGDLYDKPQEPKVVDKHDIQKRRNNLLPSITNDSGKRANKDIPVVSVYDYADPDGRTGNFSDDYQFMEDNNYEAVDGDLTGIRDNCAKANEEFRYDYADQESSSIKCYNIDSISVANKNESIDKCHENIEPPENSSICGGVPSNYILPPNSSLSPSSSSLSLSASPVSHMLSPLSSKTSTGSTAYVNSPRLRSANKPITASKPNATDGYANSPNLRAGKKESKSSELTVNGGDFNDKGNDNQSNVVQVVLANNTKSITLSSEA